MSVDYIVSSLPTLVFGAPAPISWESFSEQAPESLYAAKLRKWSDIEIQLRNAIAVARHGERFVHPAEGCSLFWKNRILACFQEEDIARRDELIDRVWWDAAEELTPPADPLGSGALATYSIRLKIALRRAKISTASGNEAFDRLTAETKITF